MKKQPLNIVDEKDEITGSETREKIHKEGLWHREVHVYFITPKHEIILQHRAKDKDTYPDMLDATVGGHVEIGETYEEAVVKEVKEETGLSLRVSDFIFIDKVLPSNSKDKKTGTTNNSIKKEFIYMFSGDINELKIEEGKAFGFEKKSIDDLKSMNQEERARIIPYIYNFIINDIQKYLIKKSI